MFKGFVNSYKDKHATLKHFAKVLINFAITSASHAVPLPDRLGHLLGDVDAVAVEPLIAVIAATTNERSKCMSTAAFIRAH